MPRSDSRCNRDPLLECLLVLAGYHDRKLSPEAAVAGLPLHQGTLSPDLFPRAAQRAGLACRFARSGLSQINQALLPAVLILQDNSACVLLGFDEQNQARLLLPDLPETEVQQPLEQLNANYSGRLIYCRPEFHFDRHAPRVREPSRGHWFWEVIRENRRLYRDVLLAAVMINLFAVAMPLFVMNVYDRVVPNHATSTLWVLSAGIVIVLLADLTLRLARAWFVDLAASRADIKLSSRIMEKVLGMSLAHRPASAGAFASNVQSFESIRSFIGSFTVVALVDLPFVLLFVVIIGLISWPLVLPILVGALMVLVYATLAQRKLQRLAEDSMRAGAMRNATLVESISQLETLKSFAAEHKPQAEYERSTLFVSRIGAQMRLVSASITNGALTTQHLVAVVIIMVGVYLVIEGEMSQGGLIAAYLLSSRAMAPISQAAGLISQYHQAATALESLEDIMARPQEREGCENRIQRPLLKGDIEFTNVSFRYPEDERMVLRGINLKVGAGEHVAVLGKNGSGKSTLEKLILGLYQPESGAVLLDGVDLRQLDPHQLRHNIGYVPQDIELMRGSLRDNILLSNPGATDEQLLRATELSGLSPLVDQHPAGFDLPVGESGQMLSGGQKQAVAIARALINDPPILIMDEPTGALDNAAEERFKARLKTISQERTLIMVTHRTSLLELASRIVVMDGGQTVADGPKEDVVEALRQGRVRSASS